MSLSQTPGQQFALAEHYYQQRDLIKAEATLRQILAAVPNQIAALGKLANVLQDQGKLSEAIDAYGRLSQLDPSDSNAFYNLGNVLRLNGKVDQAITAFEKVLTLNAQDFEAHHMLGNLWRDRQQINKAIHCYHNAIKLNPHFVEAMLDLGNALRMQAQFAAACDCYRQAVNINPGFALAHYNLGVTLMEQGLFDDAIKSYRQAIARAPQLYEAQWNCALALLMIGNYSEGWPLFDARLLQGPRLMYRFTEPRWQGEDLAGKTILVHAEQGFGDTMQFVRYAALLQEKYHPSKLILECQPELKRLLTGLTGITEIVAGNVDKLPPFDVQIPLLSLPLLFKTSVETIPKTIPYIAAPKTLQQKWKDRLAAERRKKIGIAWAGRPTHPNDVRRSIAYKTLSSLLSLQDACFVSLQKGGPNAADSSELPFLDCTAELTDFADTAALVSQLDLVISVDTAVVHLAGAMGKPIWLLNSYEGEWRWMRDRPDSPWYPSLRIFRQPKPGDWETVIQQVKSELTKEL